MITKKTLKLSVKSLKDFVRHVQPMMRSYSRSSMNFGAGFSNRLPP